MGYCIRWKTKPITKEAVEIKYVKPMIYSHEHTTIDLSGVKKDLDCRLDDIGNTIDEFRGLSQRGVVTLIDVTNRGMGRNTTYVNRVEKETGLKILCSTGYYKEPFLPEEVYRLSEQELAGIMIDEIRHGIRDTVQDGFEDTGMKASIIGEIGTSREKITSMEEKVFCAASRAHAETGVPIVTHTTLGFLGMEQITIFKKMEVDLSKVVLSHIDLSGDLGYMLRLLDTGVNIAFDTIGKKNYQADEDRVQWLCDLCSRGYSGQIVISMDITRKSHFKANAGLGYSYLLDSFIPMAEKAGLKENDFLAIINRNPRRIYMEGAQI